MKRILFLHQVSTIGGASYCLLAMVRGLDRKRFEPVVMLCTEGPLVEELKKMKVETYLFPEMATIPYNQSLLHYDTLWYYTKVEKAQFLFAKRLKELSIDTVYLNNMMLYPYLKTAKRLGCKTIMHIREHWPNNEHRLQMKRARNYAKRYADALIAINHYSESMFPECKNKIAIVYDWFDIDKRYERIPFSKVFGKDYRQNKVFLFTGGIGRIKGTYEVVKTFTNFVKGNEYRLLIMGAGTDYELRFDGFMGFAKRVLMMTGWKPYGYKVLQMMNSDKRIVCISPTYNMVDIYRQAYCTISYFTIPHANLALAEAVALGTVGIAAETEESIEYTNNGKGAILFKMNDMEEFARKIDYVNKNYDAVKKQVQKNADSVREMFLPEKNIEKFNAICQKVSYN